MSITKQQILEALEESKAHWINDNVNMTKKEFNSNQYLNSFKIFSEDCALCELFLCYINCIVDNISCPLGSTPCCDEWVAVKDALIDGYYKKFIKASKDLIARIDTEIAIIKSEMEKGNAK